MPSLILSVSLYVFSMTMDWAVRGGRGGVVSGPHVARGLLLEWAIYINGSWTRRRRRRAPVVQLTFNHTDDGANASWPESNVAVSVLPYKKERSLCSSVFWLVNAPGTGGLHLRAKTGLQRHHYIDTRGSFKGTVSGQQESGPHDTTVSAWAGTGVNSGAA